MRPFSLLVAAAVVFATGFTVAAQTPASPAQAGPQHRELLKPQNLQVLPKDISLHDLLATMRGFTRALGVECSFCHANNPQTHRLDFASDEKPDKHTARTMIRMADEINSKYLATVNDPDASPEQKTVTCGTCHRGQTMPAPFHPAGGAKMHHAAPPKTE